MKGARIVVGVSGGIAAYKACEIVSSLVKLGADVHVIMTENATQFLSPLTFQALTKNNVTTSLFGDEKAGTKHISLAKACDLALIAPCTANVIGKIAHGIADDFLTTFVMACKSPIVIAPAMNTNMYESAAYKENASILLRRGFLFVEPSSGNLACGDVGKGRLQDPQVIVEFLQGLVAKSNDLSGKNLLITAGATITKIDPVRYISNYSSGKMGLAIAKAASRRGARVTLVLGKTSVPVDCDCNMINVSTTQEMYRAVMDNLESSDIIIKAAAPSDYVLASEYSSKIKGKRLSLELEKGVDIALEVGKVKGNKKLVIFAAESDDLVKNATEKLKNKSADMVVANDITMLDAGFNVDTNIATLILKGGKAIALPKMTKSELADVILDNTIKLL